MTYTPPPPWKELTDPGEYTIQLVEPDDTTGWQQCLLRVKDGPTLYGWARKNEDTP